MPDATYPVDKFPIGLSQVTFSPLVLTSSHYLSTCNQWFTCVHLSISHMTHNYAFSITLTTLALYQSSLWLFEACSCKPAPRGPPSSIVQLSHLVCSFLNIPCVSTAHKRPNEFISLFMFLFMYKFIESFM